MNTDSAILNRIRKGALSLAGDRRLTRVRFGDHTTAVCLSDGRVGLAMHFLGDGTFGNEDESLQPEMIRRLEGLPATEVIRYLGDSDPLKSSAAVACVNALELGEEVQDGHFLDVLDLHPSDTFGMIGNFVPLLDRIRPQVKDLLVFELVGDEANGILPTCLAPVRLPECDVVVITGTTLINGTLEKLLDACTRARDVVLAGPSTILYPDAYTHTPVTWLAGARVMDPETVLAKTEEAFSFRQLREYLRKVLLPVPVNVTQ